MSTMTDGEREIWNEMQRDAVDDEDDTIPCSRCGKPTTFDPTYGDLCYRCCRAKNE